MKKNLALLLITCIIATGLLNAQTDHLAKVIYKTDNNLLVKSATATDYYGYMMLADYNSAAMIIKLDSLCEVEWAKKVMDNNVGFKSILTLPDLSYLIAGRIQNPQDNLNNLILVKINYYGDTIWTKSYRNQNNIIVSSSSLTYDSGFIISGYEVNSDNMKSMFVSKLDKFGNLIWHRVIDIPDWQSVSYSAREMSDKSVVATGYISNNETYVRRTSIVKISETGDIIWFKKCETNDGVGFDIVDNSQGFQILGTSNYRMALMKCDEYGDVIWTKSYNCGIDFEMYEAETPKLCVTNNNSYLFSTSESWWAGKVIEIDTTGDVLDYWELFLLAQNVVKNGHGKYLIYGNGPLWGVKSSSLYGEYQIGIISGVPGDFHSECSYSGTISQRYDTISTDTVSYTVSGNLELVSLSFSCEYVTLDHRDGCVDIIGTVSDNSEDIVFNVYPNPTKNNFTIRSSIFENEACNIEIIDMLGRKVTETLSTSGTKTVLINTNGWERGLYIVRIIKNGDIVGNERIAVD